MNIVLAYEVRFEPAFFLRAAGLECAIVSMKAKETIFSQGDPAGDIFYLQSGTATLTVVSRNGRQVPINLLRGAGDFVGEEAIARVPGRRLANAVTDSACTVLKMKRVAMIRALHEEPAFSDLFWCFLLGRNMKTQADLIDRVFDSSEKRLARILLLMADFGRAGDLKRPIPKITQEVLAEMVGTTRSRVSFFMNRFRKLGFIEYNGEIHVNKSLLNVILRD